MKTMQTIINPIHNPSKEILLNTDFYKTIYANQLTSNDIGKIIYFIHNRGISCRKITKLIDTHFTHSAIDNNSSAKALISHFEFPMYIETSRDKLFDTATRIILDNDKGNKKPESVLEFFSNRDLVLYTSKLLE
jgi:hypothetical protein